MLPRKISPGILNLTRLVWLEPPPPYISLNTKMDILITNQGELPEQVTKALKAYIDENNIGGR